MDAIEAVEKRSSALKLGAPGPTPPHLEQILRAGARAPDHGRLAPWRFIVIEGDARHKFGDAMARCHKRNAPDASADALTREAEKAFRAPTIIAVGAKVTSGGKIPEIEQVLAAGAAAQNMFLVARALGYGVMWKTGAPAYDPEIKALLGLAPADHIVAFLYIGTETMPGTPRDAADPAHVRRL